MRYTLPTLFGITFACAVLTGFVALPSDFQRLITAAVFVLVGIASGFHVAFAPEEKQSLALALGFIAFVILLSLTLLVKSMTP